LAQDGLQIGLEALRIEVDWQAQIGAIGRVGMRHATILTGAPDRGNPQ
jgi:hypothetical protein